jgi:hypothetical protein
VGMYSSAAVVCTVMHQLIGSLLNLIL